MQRSAIAHDPQCAYDARYAEAVRLAGEPDDITQRSAILSAIYHDSQGNYPFPLIVLHGALWADRFLQYIPRLITLLHYRYFYRRERQLFYATVLTQFAQALKTINRQVFIDTYTNYYFTREFGHAAATLGILPPDLSAALDAMHAATKAGSSLTVVERRRLYLLSLHQEQETTVAPGVERAVAQFTCPILRRLCLRPPVRFAYFPGVAVFFFRDFACKRERIERAVAAYDLAERRGWHRVVGAIAHYGVLPASFFANPVRFEEELIGWLTIAPDCRGPVPTRCRELSSSAIVDDGLTECSARGKGWPTSSRLPRFGRG